MRWEMRDEKLKRVNNILVIRYLLLGKSVEPN